MNIFPFFPYIPIDFTGPLPSPDHEPPPGRDALGAERLWAPGARPDGLPVARGHGLLRGLQGGGNFPWGGKIFMEKPNKK